MPIWETELPREQRERLLRAIPLRFSERSYAAPPTAAEWAELSYRAAACERDGVRIHLCTVPENLFTGLLLGMGKTEGCTTAAVLSVRPGDRSRLAAGYAGEIFVLEAAAMGIHTCWMTGTFQRRLIDLELDENDRILGVIALGHGNTPSAPTRRRKSMSKLCQSDPAAWDEATRNAAAMVLAAPSALNLQPWQVDGGNRRFLLHARNPLELGIALAHATAALPELKVWDLAEDMKTAEGEW